ncbi:MAG TPA: BBP7 family outer membrane beta-barrel protein [Lacipirellula sp.]
MRRLYSAALGLALGGAATLSTAAAYGQYTLYGQAPAAGYSPYQYPATAPMMVASHPQAEHVPPGQPEAYPPAQANGGAYAPNGAYGGAEHQHQAHQHPAPQHAGYAHPGGQPTAPPCYSGMPSYVGPVAPHCYTTPAPMSGCIDGCAPAMCSAPCWSVYAGALLFFQDNENHHTFSFDDALEANQYLDWHEMDADFLPGFEVGISRFDCCCMTGWEGVYWGLFPSDSSATVYNTDVTGNLDPILDFSQLDYNGGAASNYTNAAMIHRLRRTSEIHNAEFNRLWGVPTGCGPCSPWTIRTLAGFRFFRFEEGLEFGMDANDAMLTGEADELYYTIDTENNLYGLQIGGMVERRAWGRLGLTAGAKAGVFGNDASAHSRIGGAAGAATVNNGPNNGQVWDITAEKQDVAFLAEVRAGLTYQITPRWKAIGQYRVLGASGVALPTNQIYHDLRGVNDVQLLGTNGSLLLHGVFVGAERVF